MLCSVIDDGMIPFAAYTSAETPHAIQWTGQPPKLPIPVGNLEPIEYVVPWAHASQPETASQLV